MNQKAGKPNMIKLINQSIIRKIFMSRRTLACAEISVETGISITTVRAVMNEMLNKGELISVGLGESSGGRKSEQFIFNDDCYYGISVCIADYSVFASIVNIHSEIVETQTIPVKKKKDSANLLVNLLEDRINEKIKAIGIGVPGIVAMNGFVKKANGELTDNVDILTPLKQRFSLPIILENDLRASALGFSKEIKNEFKNPTVAFINFESGCKGISAGFVEGQKIIRGIGNYSGELGLMPYDDKRDFCEALYNTKSENERSKIIAKLLSWICCAINPHQIMLCSNSEFKINDNSIKKYLAHHLPDKMLPVLFTGHDFKQYFIKGMAKLTSDAIFRGNDNEE